MTSEEPLETWIVQRLSKALGRPVEAIDPAAPFTRLGIDSMVLVGFAAELEEHVGQALDLQALIDYPSPRALAAHLKPLASNSRS